MGQGRKPTPEGLLLHEAASPTQPTPPPPPLLIHPCTGRQPAGLQLLASRHCTHKFDPSRPVPRKVIHEILDTTRTLPSSANTQPWHIVVTQGATRDRLCEKMLQKFDAGDDGKAQYENRPKDMVDRMEKAVNDYGRQFYEEHFGVPRGDKAGRREKYRPNYEFWGAPVRLLLCLLVLSDQRAMPQSEPSVHVCLYLQGGGGIPRGEFSAGKIPYFILVRNFPLIFQGEVRNFPRAEFCPCKQPDRFST